MGFRSWWLKNGFYFADDFKKQVGNVVDVRHFPKPKIESYEKVKRT